VTGGTRLRSDWLVVRVPADLVALAARRAPVTSREVSHPTCWRNCKASADSSARESLNPPDAQPTKRETMTFKTPLNPSRRSLLITAGADVAVGAAFQAIGTSALAQSAKGTVKAIGFDAFTIFNPFSVDAVIEENFPGKGTQLANAWRTRIFEYCWQRTLNRTYVDFWQVLDDALTFAFKAAKAELKPDVRAKLMDAFLQLKPWPDSVEALQSMRKAGIRLAYVSNLTPKMLNAVSQNAGIAGYFEHVLSTDRVKAYKTDPRAYKMAEDAFKLPRKSIVFAAFGGWDAAGAKSFGLNTFWVNRAGAPMEELGVKPDATGTTLTELAKYVGA
jgi:2-haloacid dehalogenase